jgi:hypothetical protein
MGLADPGYIVLWLFPIGVFQWVYGNGLIHCRGNHPSFSGVFAHECPDMVISICNPGTNSSYKAKSSKKGLHHPHMSALPQFPRTELVAQNCEKQLCVPLFSQVIVSRYPKGLQNHCLVTFRLLW